MMSIKNFSFRPALLVLLAVLLVSYACTKVEDNTRSGSLLTITSITGIAGGESGEQSTPLLSDTCDNPDGTIQDPETCTVFNDNATVTFQNDPLDLLAINGSSFLQDIIVNRYRVDYFRSNNRNTPGVDVPFGIDGTMNIRVTIGGSSAGGIVVVRHEAKREPPLAFLDSDQSEGVITAQAQLQFFGQDIAGHNVSTTGFLEIHFANFGEGQ